jgi:hypothetical protein
MAFIALLSARDCARAWTAPHLAPQLIDFGGQPLVEYQARLALAQGADRVLILADSPTSDLTRLVDEVAEEGRRPVALVQDMLSLARALSPDDQIILLAENLVVPADALAALRMAGPAALLVVPSVPATARFERIDGAAMWAGALALPGRSVLGTLDMLGDWDLALTLLRRAVQDGVPRVALSPELVMDGRLTIVPDQAAADLALQALSDRNLAALTETASGLGSLLAPVSRKIVRELVRRQVEPSTLGAVTLLLAAAGIALGFGSWIGAGLVLLLLALAASDLTRQTTLVTLRATDSPRRHGLVQAAALTIMALLGYRQSDGQILALAGAWLPLAFVALLAYAENHGGEDYGTPAGIWWRRARITVPGAAILLFFGQLLGLVPAAFALLGALVCAVVALRLLPADGPRV